MHPKEQRAKRKEEGKSDLLRVAAGSGSGSGWCSSGFRSRVLVLLFHLFPFLGLSSVVVIAGALVEILGT
jgi:hypothetical protein